MVEKTMKINFKQFNTKMLCYLCSQKPSNVMEKEDKEISLHSIIDYIMKSLCNGFLLYYSLADQRICSPVYVHVL